MRLCLSEAFFLPAETFRDQSLDTAAAECFGASPTVPAGSNELVEGVSPDELRALVVLRQTRGPIAQRRGRQQGRTTAPGSAG